MFVLRVIDQLKKHKIQYALVGGHAVALHGAVRGTVDVDFIVRWKLDNLQKCELALGELGLISRHPINSTDIFKFRDEYIKNRNLIAWNFINPNDPTEQVDIIITHDLHKQQTKTIKIQGKELVLLGKEDLIKMKKQSGRQQDLFDIDALLRLDDEK